MRSYQITFGTKCKTKGDAEKLDETIIFIKNDRISWSLNNNTNKIHEYLIYQEC